MFEQLSGLLIGVTGTPPWLLRFVRVSNSYQLYPDCYPSLCSTCVTYGTLCHAIGYQLLPTQSCSRECYGFEGAFFTFRCFLPCTPSCCFEGLPGSRQVSRASCLSSKHSPSPTICLNHSNPQKTYTGRFYLRARAGQSRNINLYGELVLRNINF